MHPHNVSIYIVYELYISQEIEEWMKTENLEELEAMRREFETADALTSPVAKSADLSPGRVAGK